MAGAKTTFLSTKAVISANENSKNGLKVLQLYREDLRILGGLHNYYG